MFTCAKSLKIVTLNNYDRTADREFALFANFQFMTINSSPFETVNAVLII